jgi:hypothetical protein
MTTDSRPFLSVSRVLLILALLVAVLATAGVTFPGVSIWGVSWCLFLLSAVV